MTASCCECLTNCFSFIHSKGLLAWRTPRALTQAALIGCVVSPHLLFNYFSLVGQTSCEILSQLWVPNISCVPHLGLLVEVHT